jgi:hypothetical protein
MQTLGHIAADNPQNPADRNSIRQGLVTGDGLLGSVVTALKTLELCAIDYGFSDTARNHESLQAARLAVFDALKAIERAALGPTTWEPWVTFRDATGALPIAAPPCAHCQRWQPVAEWMTLLNGAKIFDCVRLCHAIEQSNDFSCFRPKNEHTA